MFATMETQLSDELVVHHIPPAPHAALPDAAEPKLVEDASNSEEDVALLPRNTKVIVTGNNRTKHTLIGLHGVVTKAVGLGGWHWLVSARHVGFILISVTHTFPAGHPSHNLAAQMINLIVLFIAAMHQHRLQCASGGIARLHATRDPTPVCAACRRCCRPARRSNCSGMPFM